MSANSTPALPSQASVKSAMSANSIPALPSQASVKSAMSASSLPTLPTEIITEIFKSTANFSTATALGSTCRGFQSVWKSNAASICYAILVRTITCFDQAFQYVQLQPLDAVSSELIEETDLLAVKATKQFFENADVARMALRIYETSTIESVSRASLGLGSLTEAQHDCFLRAWYRLHTLASLPGYPLPYSMLASLDRLEFEQMRDVLHWLRIGCPVFRHRPLEFEYWQGPLVKLHITGVQWYDLEGWLNSLFKELGRPLSRRFNFWRFIVHEVYLDIEESGKGDSLADKLPPMDKQDNPHQFIDSFHGFVLRDAK